MLVGSRPSGSISSSRKAAAAVAGCALWMASGAHAADIAATASSSDAALQPADPEHESIVVTGERYRINTLNSRLPDVRDAPQSISIIPREVIEQQAATTLNDVLRNVSGISMAAGEGGGGGGRLCAVDGTGRPCGGHPRHRFEFRCSSPAGGPGA